MHERLIEGWIDAASERSYQTPFLQMLVGQGHTIIHNTRHATVELGKDVITIDRSGNPCAYQLKAANGGRLRLSDYRSIENQLLELINIPINYPGVPDVQHRSFLVTNGEIEEEVQIAVDRLNQGYKRDGFPKRKLELLNRGQLIAWARDLGSSLWPSELDDIDRLLHLLVEDGRNQYPIQKLDSLLRQILDLDEGKTPSTKKRDLQRRVTSAAILTSLTLRSFSRENNYLAELTAWVTYASYVIAAYTRASLPISQLGQAAINIALDEAFADLHSLAREVEGRGGDYSERPAYTDWPVYKPRLTLLAGLMSLYWMWCQDEGWPPDADKDTTEAFLASTKSDLQLWGEAAIPQLLLAFWYYSQNAASIDSEPLVVALLRSIIGASSHPNTVLANPYYDLDDVLRHNWAGALGIQNDPLRRETVHDTSHYAESLMHILARRNLKQTCKSLWYGYSKLHLREFYPDEEWKYCTWRSQFGKNLMKTVPCPEEWEHLLDQAACIKTNEIPQSLTSNRYLFALFILLFPHRGRPDAIGYLASQFDPIWLISRQRSPGR